MALGWSQGTWGAGPFGEGGEAASVDVTGVAASGSVGVSNASIKAYAVVSGVSTEVLLGVEEPVAGIGWGSNTWGFNGWGGVVSVEVFVTGVEATSATGTVEINGKSTVVLVGEAALGVLETGVAVDAGANHGVVGEQATINIGEVEIDAKANVTLTGIVGSGAIGTAEVDAKANVDTSGLQAAVVVGTVEIDAKANVIPIGVSASVRLGVEEVSGDAIVNVTGVVGTVVLGQVRQSTSNTVRVTGVAGTISQGSVAINGDATVYLTGVSASCNLRPGRNVSVWGLIDTSQTPNWVPIAA
jgi:hypothetical protein